MLSVCSADCCVGQVCFFFFLFWNSPPRVWKPGGSVLESLGFLGRKSALDVGCYCLVLRLGSGQQGLEGLGLRDRFEPLYLLY